MRTSRASTREEIADLAAAGCRYLQLDEVNLAYLCDPALARVRSRNIGEDPASLPQTYAKLLNDTIAGKPADMTVCMHLCRGNFAGAWVAEGGYEPVAELLFNAINVDGYFLEYDSERAGGFEPLRFLPKGKVAVLGLVTTKSAQLESKDDLKRRIDRGSALRAARATRAQPAVRLRERHRRQHHDSGAGDGEAAAGGRNRTRRLGQRVKTTPHRGTLMLTVLRLFFALTALALASNTASAQYPTRPVRLVVGFAPGGPTDILARRMAQYLADKLGQPVRGREQAGRDRQRRDRIRHQPAARRLHDPRDLDRERDQSDPSTPSSPSTSCATPFRSPGSPASPT